MDYEPLDSLPYIDGEITEEERQVVQDLIFKELSSQNLEQLHPKVQELFPELKEGLIIKDLHPEELKDQSFTLGGIDLLRYSNTEDPEALKKSIAYSYLKQNSLKIQSNYGKNQWLISNDLLEISNERIRGAIDTKRRKIEQTNYKRKLDQIEAEPVLKYMEQRWKEGVSSNIDNGVEILKLQNK